MKSKIMKIMGIVMTVAMLASFMVAGSPVSAAGNPASVNNWQGVTLPNTVPGTDVELIEQANDGTIFISVFFGSGTTIGTVTINPNTWAMFKSTDGYTWTLTNIYNLPTANRITAICPSANYSADKTVYVAVNTSALGYSTLYRCTNAAAIGTPYGEMGQISGGLGATLRATVIYDLDSYYDGSDVWLLAATDVDAFIIKDDRAPTTVWTDLGLSETLGGAYSDYATPAVGVNVYKAMFAADYSSSGVIWAVYYDEYASPALATRFATLTGGTKGYGLIARSAGSTLWGTAITPVIVNDATGAKTYTVTTTAATTVIITDFDGGSITSISGATTGAFALDGGGTFDPGEYQYDALTNTLSINTANAEIITITYNGVCAANVNCDLEFAATYSSSSAPELYAALSFAGNTAADDLYRIECGFYGTLGSVTQFDVDPAPGDRVDFCSLEVVGNVIIAGTQDTFPGGGAATEVWYSVNNGTSWSVAAKNPTGTLVNTCNVLISEYGTTKDLAFAATGGTQSAVSISEDDGNTWTQIAFIDDVITTVNDIAFNPTGKAALLITTNSTGVSSLWKVADVTAVTPAWQRTLCEDYSTTINEFNMVEYSDDGVAIMLYDGTDNRIYRSTDNTSTFINWRNTASWGTINAWLVPNTSTVYAATTGGFFSTSLVGSRITGVNLVSIASSGDTFAVGSAAGNIYVSFNKGGAWGTAFDIPTAGTVNIYVAFDANFGISGVAGTDLLYAASADGKVYQCQLINDAADADKVFMGTATVTTLSGALLDDENKAAADATAFNGIVVADDNAMYLSGTVYSTTGSGSSSVQVLAGSQLQLVRDLTPVTDVFTYNIASAINVTGVVNGPGNTPFIDNEVLLVIGDNLAVDSAGTSITGTILVQGATSGATGTVALPAIAVTWTAGVSTVSVSSSTLILDTASTSGTPAYDAGMARILLHERNNVWEYEIDPGMAGLWYTNGSNILWTIDNDMNNDTTPGDMGISVFEDFVSGKVQGASVTEYMPNPNEQLKSATVTWTQVKEAASTIYEIDVWDASGTTATYVKTAYYTVKSAEKATGTTLSKTIDDLKASTKYTFYVRVYEQALNQSRWSTGVSLTTSAYLPSPLPVSPSQYLTDASLAPTFTWSAVSTAASYNFQLSSDNTFTNLIADANVAATGYTYSGGALTYDTDYYWRVQSVAADGTKSTWSSYSIIDPSTGTYRSTGAPSVFHTMMDPAEYIDTDTTVTTTTSITQTTTSIQFSVEVPEYVLTYTQPTVTNTITNQIVMPDDSTPAYIWAIVAIGALLTIAVIVLIIRTRRVV